MNAAVNLLSTARRAGRSKAWSAILSAVREPEFSSASAAGYSDDSDGSVAVLDAETVSEVIVEPPVIRLASGRSAVQLRVLVRDAEGQLRDATTEADYRIESGDAATLLAPGLVVATHSGSAEVVIEVAGREVRTPVRVVSTACEDRSARTPARSD
ncbi:MAG TPA: hypothetical protein VGE52_20235, partial [Pirellulales bacterium]